jgi:hypothetical protein
MATFTTHAEDRIVFETTADERVVGLLLVGHSSIFIGAPLYGLIQYGTRGDPWALLLVAVMLLAGMVEAVLGLRVILKSEWLVIDLDRRTYSGQRRLLLWGESLSGPLGDFDHIRLSVVPYGRRKRHRRLVVDWVWRDDKHRPFRVMGWGRLKSFRSSPSRSTVGSVDFFDGLRAVARDSGLPLAVPKPYLEYPQDC